MGKHNSATGMYVDADPEYGLAQAYREDRQYPGVDETVSFSQIGADAGAAELTFDGAAAESGYYIEPLHGLAGDIHYAPFHPEAAVCGASGPRGILGTPYPDLVDCPECFGHLTVVTHHQERQIRIALVYLTEHGSHPSAVARAAVILRAGPGAPRAEMGAGLKMATGLEGQKVRCSGCGTKYECRPEDPHFTDPADDKAGLCLACVMTETRPPGMTEAITPSAVHPPQRRKRPVKAAAIDQDPAPAAEPDNPPAADGEPQ
jgi:hypothetical protein